MLKFFSHKSDLPTITVESAEKYDKLSLEDIKLDIVSFVPTTKASIDDNKQTGLYFLLIKQFVINNVFFNRKVFRCH